MRENLLKYAFALGGALAIVAAVTPVQAAPIFPRIGDSTGGPALIITITDSGATTTFVSSQTYDGSDDVEVGLINNSTTAQTSLNLSGSGNGGGIFGFDGDGIINYIDANTGLYTVGNPADTTGYAGPGVTFSNYQTDDTSGTVNFSLAPGAYTYFGLEGSPDSINAGGGIVVPMPEPSTVLLLLAGVAALGASTRGRRVTRS